ncbi:acireductone dioxygenase [Pseudomonas proteolytica]|uniref:1,2-dihydroxy-3-keto-5-methylthiopentene dioxygenase n=1 Tax=Pseudomonas proteolytica TaxID=219574 RepID=UPI0014755765|nr:acireductone dioxygenase [Pseudomonas proteolytica]NMZ10846.1 acireductone dioxygenase [Pseudomonas proteolytica]
MSILFVYHVATPDTPNKVLTHADDIASTLAEHGVGFERWQANTRVEAGASAAEVMAAYQGPIDSWMTAQGYAHVEVLSVSREHPQKDAVAAGLRDEYRHDADEIRLFAAGRGLLGLHIGDYIFTVLCEKHDLLRIPAGIPRWFDLGEEPRVVAISLFQTAAGAVAQVTGSDIAQAFPGLDD